MKMKLSSLMFAAGLLVSGFATAATYQKCSVSGCTTAGGAIVWTSYAQTKYPIVLSHGMTGFNSIAGLEYFYGVPTDLTSNGANVFTTQVASFDSSYVRGEQLRSQVQQILAITGAPKVNLIAHSQGAQDSRYVAGVIPSQVASVTTVGGVNTGSPVADVISSLAQTHGLESATGVISSAINAFFTLVGVASGHYYDQSSLAGLASLTTNGTAAFNAQFPGGVPATQCGQGAQLASNGVTYFSWSGTGILTNAANAADPVLAATSLLISGPSDGLVPQCASHLGTVIRDNYNQNHFDEVNQVLGLVDPFSVNPVTLYRDQANRLKNLGL
ncbi:MAG: triacylglycerol lipase [Aquirhabdus sp.]